MFIYLVRNLKTSKIHFNRFGEKFRRNLALIIFTNWDTAVLLRKFAYQIVGERDSRLRVGDERCDNATLENCRNFIAAFDEHKETLINKIKSDYKL